MYRSVLRFLGQQLRPRQGIPDGKWVLLPVDHGAGDLVDRSRSLSDTRMSSLCASPACGRILLGYRYYYTILEYINKCNGYLQFQGNVMTVLIVRLIGLGLGMLVWGTSCLVNITSSFFSWI